MGEKREGVDDFWGQQVNKTHGNNALQLTHLLYPELGPEIMTCQKKKKKKKKKKSHDTQNRAWRTCEQKYEKLFLFTFAQSDQIFASNSPVHSTAANQLTPNTSTTSF